MSNTAQRLRMLIVEDNPAYQELYREILETEYDLDIISNREEAIAYLRAKEPDIAIIDIRLKADERGNTDGLDIAQFIHDLGYRTILILKSGFPTETPEITARLEKINVFRTLDKSADNQIQQLINAISEAASIVKSSPPTY